MLDQAQARWLKALMYDQSLTPTARVLGGILLTEFCQPEHADPVPTVADLARALNAGHRTTQRALGDLENAGWLVRKGPNGAGKPNVIILLRRGTALPFPHPDHTTSIKDTDHE